MQSVKPCEEVQKLWKKICGDLDVKDCVQLFATEDDALTVKTRERGKPPKRSVLQRSEEMEQKVIGIAKQLVDDYNRHQDNPEGEREFDGMMYMMGWKEDDGSFLPLYVGRTETLGRKGDGGLSANLKNVDKGGNKGCFARWGDGYEYHIGDLSACVLPGHKENLRHPKYQQWAETLFLDETRFTNRPKLKRPTYFWAKAWEPTSRRLWEELGPTTLAVSEYLVIGVAGKVSPSYFLNVDGVPRQFRE